jgi:hypothetical protein
MVVAPFSRQERSDGHGASMMVSRKGVAGLLTVVALVIGWRCSGGSRPCRCEAVQCRAALLWEEDGNAFSNSGAQATLAAVSFSSPFFLFSTPLPSGAALVVWPQSGSGAWWKGARAPEVPYL